MKRRAKKGINTAINDLIQLNLIQDVIMRRYNLRYASLRDLLEVYFSWVNSKDGIRPFSIVRANKRYYVSSYPSLSNRLEILQQKGLIQAISENHYVPTDQAIKELNNLLKTA